MYIFIILSYHPRFHPISVLINQCVDKGFVTDYAFLCMLLCSLSFSLDICCSVISIITHSYYPFFSCPSFIFPWFKTETRNQNLSVGRKVKKSHHSAILQMRKPKLKNSGEIAQGHTQPVISGIKVLLVIHQDGIRKRFKTTLHC